MIFFNGNIELRLKNRNTWAVNRCIMSFMNIICIFVVVCDMLIVVIVVIMVMMRWKIEFAINKSVENTSKISSNNLYLSWSLLTMRALSTRLLLIRRYLLGTLLWFIISNHILQVLDLFQQNINLLLFLTQLFTLLIIYLFYLTILLLQPSYRLLQHLAVLLFKPQWLFSLLVFSFEDFGVV